MNSQSMPDNDLNYEQRFLYTKAWHDDVTVTNELFGVSVSFYWRNLIDDRWLKTVSNWIEDDQSRPIFIVMGTLYNTF